MNKSEIDILTGGELFYCDVYPSLTDKNRHLEFVGWYRRKDKQKMYVLHCPVCAQDEELHGDALFPLADDHVRRGIVPCACGNTRLSEDQYKIVVERSATAKGYTFLGWEGEYTKITTRCKLECPIHGVWNTTRISKAVGNGGCLACWYEENSRRSRKPDSEMIEAFFSTDAFHPDTIFYRTDRPDKNNKKVYWKMECPDCGGIGESTGSDFKLGKRSCLCSKHIQTQSYLCIVKQGDTPLALKFGVTRSFDNRKRSLDLSSSLKLETVGIWQFNSVAECKAAELICVRTLVCGVLTRADMKNGFTETTSLHNLETIIKIFEENGGIRLTVH